MSSYFPSQLQVYLLQIVRLHKIYLNYFFSWYFLKFLWFYPLVMELFKYRPRDLYNSISMGWDLCYHSNMTWELCYHSNMDYMYQILICLFLSNCNCSYKFEQLTGSLKRKHVPFHMILPHLLWNNNKDGYLPQSPHPQ